MRTEDVAQITKNAKALWKVVDLGPERTLVCRSGFAYQALDPASTGIEDIILYNRPSRTQ